MSETFLNGRVTLHCGDSRDVLKTMPDNCIDSIVCDPPYALVSIVKRFGGKNAAAVKVPEGGSGAYTRASSGFMGVTWDTGETAFAVDFWAECLRVLKPGGHVVAFSGTRTVHRMVCAIEDAGFEIRDSLQWLYGQGFPKSHDVSKGIDKAAGAEREVIGEKTFADGSKARKTQMLGGNSTFIDPVSRDTNLIITAPTTAAAREWQGWGTALKPAVEPICLARKPLSEKTVAANVLRWGTGAINVDGCRVGVDETDTNQRKPSVPYKNGIALPTGDSKGRPVANLNPTGRFPANVIHDGSDEVLAGFPQTKSGTLSPDMNVKASTGWSGGSQADRVKNTFNASEGSAARFFYHAKANKTDRAGSKHPTVKPVDLMRYLCRLVTPPGGIVLDPFAGTGTTGEAAFKEGFNCVLVEREEEYQADIRRRMALCMLGPDERKREAIKAKVGDAPLEDGSLFA